MKKRYIIFTSLLALGLLFSSCEKDEKTQDPLSEGNTVTSLEDTEISCTGGSFTLAFTSDVAWTLKNCPDWLKVSKKSGKKGTTVVEMSADVNATRKDRTANLTFSAQDGSFAKPFNVSQTFPYLRVSTDTLSFNWNNGRTERPEITVNTNTEKIAISSNIHWKIAEVNPTKAANVDFINFALSAKEGENDYELEVIPIRDNFGKTPYDIQLRLYPVMEDAQGNVIEIPAAATDSYILKLHQQNLRFLINDSTDDAEIEFSEINDKKDINFSIDAEIPWKISECPNWVVLDKTQGSGVVTVNFLADGANPTKEVRSGNIRLMTDAGAYRDIAVSQKGYIFEIDQHSFDIENDDVTEKTINLSTTGTWEVKNVPDWLTVTPLSGSGAAAITVKANTQNFNFSDNAQAITINSTMNALMENVPVKQDKFIFDVTPASSLADLPTMNTTKYDVNIVSSGKWEILNKPAWLDISMESASAKGTYNFTIGPNCGNPDISTDRTATLTVVSLNHKEAGLTENRTITVKQRKYTFEVSETSFGTLAAYSPGSKKATVKCSSNWELSSYPSWITPSVTSGDGLTDATITFLVNDNLVKTSRSQDIVVKSLYNSETKTISIAQDAFVFDNGAKSYNVPVMNTAGYTVTFDLSKGAPWQISSGYDSWLKPSVSSGFGSATITFTPDPNPNLTQRTGTAVIYSSANSEGKTITFTQEKYVFDSSAENHTFTELETTKTPVTVTCSGPWTISDAPSWITLSSKSSSTSADITFTPAKNTSLTARSATFNVVSTLNNLKKPITVSQDAFEFNSTQESFSYTTLEERTDPVSILCSGKWTAQNVPSWVTMSATSGNGSEAGATDDITITSKQNLTESDRSATVKIVSTDNSAFVRNILLSQAKFNFQVSNNTFAYTSPLDVTTRSFDITCPAAWTASSDKTWLTLSTASGSAEGSITLTPEENLTTSDRSATVTVVSTLNNLKRTVVVSQPAFIFEIGTSTYTFNSPIGADNSALSVAVNCSADWTVATEADWLTLSKSGATGNGSFDVTTSTNINTTPRTADVTVTSVRNGLTEKVAITQNAYEFDATADNVTLTACPSEAVVKNITCSGNWTVSSDQSWVAATPSTTKGNGTISIKAQDNPNETDRTAVITVISTENPTLKKVFNITQKKHELVLSKASLTFNAYPATSSTIDVTTTGPWTVSSDQTWATVSQSKTSGSGSITVSVSVNPALTSRTATITVKCSNTTLQKTITVTQNAYEFDSTTESVALAACPSEGVVKNITCSGAWTASADQTWISLANSTTAGNGTLTIKAQDNPNETDRTATVTVTSSDNTSLKKIFNITQSGHVFTLSESTLAFDSYPGSTKTVDVTTTGPWTATSSQTWLTVSQNATSGNGTITVKAAVNGDLTTRNATITIKCGNTTLLKTISVSQGGYTFDSTTESVAFEATPATPVDKSVTCTGKWTAESSDVWVTVTPASSTGNGTITITAAANAEATARTATVTVTSSDNSALKKVFNISQAAKVE